MIHVLATIELQPGTRDLFLAEFHKLTGFKTAEKGESHPIALLKKYPKGFAPPFVYMTGEGSINVSESDIKILRDYLP